MTSRNRATPPLDNPAHQLAEQLNQLRAKAGMPSYRKLAGRTNYSRSALWRATRGTHLPTREVTVALAVACGGDAAEWDNRWRLAHAAVAAGNADAGMATLSASPADALRPPAARRFRRRRSVMLLTAVVMLFTGGTAVVLATLPVGLPTPTPTPRGKVIAQPADGDDPYVRGCGVDQQRVEYRNLYWPDRRLYGWLELYHSHVCNASWGYVFGPNSSRWKVSIAARRLPDNTVAPSSNQGDDPPNSWGNLLSTPPGSCVRIEAYLTVGAARGRTTTTACRPDGQSAEVGPPPTPPPPPPAEYESAPRAH